MPVEKKHIIKRISSVLSESFPPDADFRRTGQRLYGVVGEVYLCFSIQAAKYQEDSGFDFYINWGAIPAQLFGRDPFGLDEKTPWAELCTIQGRLMPLGYEMSVDVLQHWEVRSEMQFKSVEDDLQNRLKHFWSNVVPAISDLSAHRTALENDGSRYARARLEVLNECAINSR